MSGTKEGGKKLREIYMARYTPEERQERSRMAGRIKGRKGFAVTGLAKIAGSKGGKISKRGKNVRP